MKRKLLKRFFIFFIFFVSFLFIFSCVQGGKSPGFEIALSPQTINAFLKKQFPITQELKVGRLTLKDPNVASIDENEKINIGIGFEYKLPLLPAATGSILVAGGIKYDPEKKAIYLKDPEIKDFQILNKKLPSFLSSETKKILAGVVAYVFEQIPIYKFDEKSLYGRFIKDIRVENG
ncbi:MAG: DUF1439 domain-containing protein, partial [Aquificae bacterium]|nr:DUF1439 domain-containing protein [Aquificota bacterium]